MISNRTNWLWRRSFRLLVSGLLWSVSAQAQIAPGKSLPFSDFHIHTSFKNYYRRVENPDSTILYANQPGYLNRKYGRTNWIPFTRNAKNKRTGKESNMANYDQSSYANLSGLNGSVLCMSITPPEKIMLATRSQRWMNLRFVTHMPMKRQEVLAAENNSSFKEFLGEYYYAINQDSVQNGTKILLAKNNADLKRIVGEGGIGMVMTAEGGHVLFGNDVLSKLDSLKAAGCGEPCRREIFGNIDKLRQLPHRTFFITVAHFGWNKMFGNAKSLDKPGLRRGLLTAATLSDNLQRSLFAKYGEGIVGCIHGDQYRDTTVRMGKTKLRFKLPYTTDQYDSDLGYQVMYRLLDADNDFKSPIYLDVKHMDLKARFQYYQYVDSVNTQRKAQGKTLIPIVASHVGLSGKKRPVAMATGLYPLRDSYEELIFGQTFYKIQANERDQFWRAYTQTLKPSDRVMYFGGLPRQAPESMNPFQGTANYNTLNWFYPWGINFCDEEVKAIYDSDGIIGLNLDRRILGFTMPNYNGHYKRNLRRLFNDVYEADEYSLPDGTTITFEDYYRSEPLLRNIFHVVEASGRQDASAWNHVAIGSDYDGFIQPIQLAPSAEYMPMFHRKMVVFAHLFAEIHNKQALLYGLSTQTAMDKFFYTNGRDFVFKYFQN